MKLVYGLLALLSLSFAEGFCSAEEPLVRKRFAIEKSPEISKSLGRLCTLSREARKATLTVVEGTVLSAPSGLRDAYLKEVRERYLQLFPRDGFLHLVSAHIARSGVCSEWSDLALFYIVNQSGWDDAYMLMTLDFHDESDTSHNHRFILAIPKEHMHLESIINNDGINGIRVEQLNGCVVIDPYHNSVNFFGDRSSPLWKKYASSVSAENRVYTRASVAYHTQGSPEERAVVIGVINAKIQELEAYLLDNSFWYNVLATPEPDFSKIINSSGCSIDMIFGGALAYHAAYSTEETIDTYNFIAAKRAKGIVPHIEPMHSFDRNFI